MTKKTKRTRSKKEIWFETPGGGIYFSRLFEGWMPRVGDHITFYDYGAKKKPKERQDWISYDIEFAVTQVCWRLNIPSGGESFLAIVIIQPVRAWKSDTHLESVIDGASSRFETSPDWIPSFDPLPGT